MSTPTLRERTRERTRTDVLDAAALLLGEDAGATPTLEEVAVRAGVSRGTVYAHFPGGRDDLVREVYRRTAEEVATAGTLARAAAADPVERVLALATAFATVAARPDGRFYGRADVAAAPALHPVTGATSARFADLVGGDLTAARTAGHLPPDAPVPELVVLLGGALRSVGAAAADGGDVDALLTGLRLLLERLLAPSPTTPSRTVPSRTAPPTARSTR